MRLHVLILSALGLALASAPAFAQARPAPAQSAAAPAPAPIVPSMAASIPVGSRVGLLASTYDDGGRRDPFGSLVTPKRSASPASVDGARPRTGLAGLALADVVVRGVVRSGETMFALLEGPNKQSYTSKAKDRLFDATIVSIDRDGVVFSEQIEGSRATSQVRRSLRPAGDGIR